MNLKSSRIEIIRTHVPMFIISGLLGICFSFFVDLVLLPDSDQTSIGRITLLGAITGVGISTILSLIEPEIRRLRKKPLWMTFILTPIIYSAFIGIVYGAAFILIMGYNDFKSNSFIVETLAFSLCITAAITFLDTINCLLGKSVLRGLITGRYHRPITERRFVMFLDLAGSTTIAERIGNISFHSLLNDFFCDISRPVMDGKGDIYKYVGDEAIITWPANVSGQSPVASFFAIREAIARRAADYERLYGEVPRFRAGLHFGEVIVGEMGLYKTEIALLGDVMNTASRIQSQCRALGADFLASSDAMAALGNLSGEFSAVTRGKCELRGKENSMELFELGAPSSELTSSGKSDNP